MAMFETLIYQIKPLREEFAHLLSAQHDPEADLACANLRDLGKIANALTIFNALMNLPVSKISVMKDMIWDFNDEAHLIARNIEGAKSRIDFGIYTNLNSTILFELRIAFMCILQMPGAVRAG